ncbi:MAG: hypothetical protein ACR2NG_09695 [Acidimicrobiia bacterium]
MRTVHIAIGMTSVAAIAASSIALVIDPDPIDDVAAALIAVGLMIAGTAALAGLALARAPWGRWGLAATVVLALLIGSVSSNALMWVAYGLGALALLGLFGPWLRLWTRHHRVAEAPGPAPISLISVAAVAALFVGLCAVDQADWTHWTLAAVAIASSVAYAQGATLGVWGFRIVVPAPGILTASHTTMPGVIPLGVGIAAVTILGWLPQARQTTTVITPPLPPPVKRTAR